MKYFLLYFSQFVWFFFFERRNIFYVFRVLLWAFKLTITTIQSNKWMDKQIIKTLLSILLRTLHTVINLNARTGAFSSKIPANIVNVEKKAFGYSLIKVNWKNKIWKHEYSWFFLHKLWTYFNQINRFEQTGIYSLKHM